MIKAVNGHGQRGNRRHETEAACQKRRNDIQDHHDDEPNPKLGITANGINVGKQDRPDGEVNERRIDLQGKSGSI